MRSIFEAAFVAAVRFINDGAHPPRDATRTRAERDADERGWDAAFAVKQRHGRVFETDALWASRELA